MPNALIDETMKNRRLMRLEGLAGYVNSKKAGSEDFVVFAVLAEKGQVKQDKTVRGVAFAASIGGRLPSNALVHVS